MQTSQVFYVSNNRFNWPNNVLFCSISTVNLQLAYHSCQSSLQYHPILLAVALFRARSWHLSAPLLRFLRYHRHQRDGMLLPALKKKHSSILNALYHTRQRNRYTLRGCMNLPRAPRKSSIFSLFHALEVSFNAMN